MPVSKVFLYSCLIFLSAVLIYEFINIPQSVALGFFFFSFFSFLILFLIRDKKSVFLNIFLIFFIFTFALSSGFYLRGRVEKNISNSIFRQKGGEKVQFEGIIKKVDREANQLNLIVEIEGKEGKVLIRTARFPEFNYGDKLKIKGRLQKPPVFEDFNYRKFLEKEGVYATLYYPKISLIEEGKGSFVYSGIINLKNKFREVIYTNLSPPHSLILRAVLLGDKDKLGKELGEKLNFAGVRHITAISGMHILIMAMVIGSFFKSKRSEFIGLLIFLLFFISMIGFPASAVRASVMILMIKLASLFGRMKNPFHILTIVATGMVILNPLLLKYSLGFQLSFLAVIGITYFYSYILEKINFIPISKIREVLAVTLSAQVFVLPFLLYKLGFASALSPFSNILIVPLIPLILGIGFVFIILGAISPLLGKLLLFIIFPLIEYVVRVVEFFSQFEFLVFEKRIPLFLLIFIYLFLIYFTFKINKKEPLAFYPY